MNRHLRNILKSRMARVARTPRRRVGSDPLPVTHLGYLDRVRASSTFGRDDVYLQATRANRIRLAEAMAEVYPDTATA